MFYAIGQMFTVVCGKILKNNPTIWSHCYPTQLCPNFAHEQVFHIDWKQNFNTFNVQFVSIGTCIYSPMYIFFNRYVYLQCFVGIFNWYVYLQYKYVPFSQRR